jgi:hypothetical protein
MTQLATNPVEAERDDALGEWLLVAVGLFPDGTTPAIVAAMTDAPPNECAVAMQELIDSGLVDYQSATRRLRLTDAGQDAFLPALLLRATP